MKRVLIEAALLAFVVFASKPLFSQSSNGTISGTVSDASRAVLPGVTVTATNTATGVVTTVLSNDAGVYNFASLLPGTYKLTVELAGFRTDTFNDVQLGNNAQLRINATLEVAAAAQSVEVSVEAANLITTSSSSVGEVLPQKQVEDLPIVTNNVLDLVGVMGGTFMTNDKVFGAENTTLAGVSARDINIQRDGISVNNERWPNGLDTPTKMNPDLVGEVRMILAPVDAEMGRGNGQIQIQTRAGTNQFRGAAVWNVQNSVFDANTWLNNSTTPVVSPPWRNMHEYNLAYGGPIVKNKTFFYALWNQLIVETRQEVFPTVLTPCARMGIFRYYNNYLNGNATQLPTTVGGVPQVPVVNIDGSPRSPDGSPLRYLSVFGPLASNPTKNDCSDAAINTTTLVPNGAASGWDPFRQHLDNTGFMASQLADMPIPNAYNILGSGDGLNTGVLRWVLRNHGADNLFGAGGDINNERKQINVRIDHNFNQRHRISGSYSYESDISDDAALPSWPKGYFGSDFRKPQVLSVNFISTLKNTLLNEARFGLSRTGANTVGAPERTDIGATVRKQLFQVNGGPVYTNIAAGIFATFGSFYGVADGILYGSHEVSPRWIYADNVSWTKGKHAFKFGGEYRWSGTKSSNEGSVQTGPNRPTINLGAAFLAPVLGIGRAGLAGTPFSGNWAMAQNLLNFMSGSVSGIAQGRFINQLNGQWNNYPNELTKVRDLAQNEFGFFFKDDWKATRDLTLNLGMRWDYFGVPWERNGLTTALQGGGYALFGISGRSFSNWMQPGVNGDLMHIIYVGPNSPNPGGSIYNRSLNNFGPAVGFAYSVPWLGKDKTTVRGGYQIQYTGGGRGFVLDTAIGNPPGSSNTANYLIPANDPYLSLEKIAANPTIIPVQPTFLPSKDTLIPLTDRTGLMNAFDPNFATPYIQNVTLSVTRTLSSKLTLDVRYIGTLSRKLPGNMDLNSVNFKYNGVLQALDKMRRGDDTPGLFDKMFKGLNIAGSGCDGIPFSPTCGAIGGPAVNGIPQTAGVHLRASSTFNSNLANGGYTTIASNLNTLTNPGATNGGDPNAHGSVLRNSGLFPENFFVTNPQVSSSVMETNLGHANYHSLQTQLTLRPVGGVNTSMTYTWSRNLGFNPGEGPNGVGATMTDPTDRRGDYTLQLSSRTHVLTNYGTFALPVGPQKLLFTNSHGIAARLLENWQTSWVVNVSSGAPQTIAAAQMLYGNGVPDIVGAFNRHSSYSWANGAPAGNLFSDSKGQPLYSVVQDPQCNNPSIVAPSLAPLCTLNALQNNATGQIVLQNPLPGRRGTLGQNAVFGLPTWRADMGAQKRIKISETKSMTVRFDASNVFNHSIPALSGGFFAATAGAPNLDTTNPFVPFGAFNNKVGTGPNTIGNGGGNRSFQLKARVDF